MARIVIYLTASEKDALIKLALQQLRDPRDQVRLLVQRELERCGLLEKNQSASFEDPAPESSQLNELEKEAHQAVIAKAKNDEDAHSH